MKEYEMYFADDRPPDLSRFEKMTKEEILEEIARPENEARKKKSQEPCGNHKGQIWNRKTIMYGIL